MLGHMIGAGMVGLAVWMLSQDDAAEHSESAEAGTQRNQANITDETHDDTVITPSQPLAQAQPEAAPSPTPIITKTPVYPKRGDKYQCPHTGEMLQARALGGRRYHAAYETAEHASE